MVDEASEQPEQSDPDSASVYQAGGRLRYRPSLNKVSRRTVALPASGVVNSDEKTAVVELQSGLREKGEV